MSRKLRSAMRTKFKSDLCELQVDKDKSCYKNTDCRICEHQDGMIHSKSSLSTPATATARQCSRYDMIIDQERMLRVPTMALVQSWPASPSASKDNFRRRRAGRAEATVLSAMENCAHILSATRRPSAASKSNSTSMTARNKTNNRLTSTTSVIISSLVLMLYAISTSCQLALSTSILANDNNSNSKTLKSDGHVLASFSTPNQAINITHVTYDPLYDAVYLGATNTIYQLNGSDLNVLFEQTTGPIFDNPNCGITECHGFEDYMKPTQNVNKILVIDYQHKKLLSCGSTKQGACRRYQLNNIAQKEDLIPMAVAANDDNSSTYAFIAPARYTYDPLTTTSTSIVGNSNSNSNSNNNNNNNLIQQQQVLYVASTYTKAGQSRELLVPAIGTRTLDDGPNLLKLYENSFLDSARIDINSHLRDYFLVNYLYGFASSNYIYFVTVQKKATSRDFEELGYHTRLARICITDSSYNSYTEVDLKCVPNKRRMAPAARQSHQHQQASEYPLLQDAILVDAGSQLLQSLAQNDQASSSGSGASLSSASFLFGQQAGSSSDDNKVLLGVFSSARDHTQHPGQHSAICAFSLAQIEDKFNDNIHSCYTGKMQSRNMEYIAGNVQECPKNGQGGNVVNFCHETLKINGTTPIVSEASIQFYNTTLTAITATSHINSQAKNIYSEQLASDLSISASSNGPAASIKKDSQFGNNIAHQQASGARQHTVVFAGTSNGHIKKILLNNATNGVEFEDAQLDTNPILSDLHLHSSGQLIAATPYKVMKVSTHNCAQYTSCRECSQSKNPYCGWCSLKKSCTIKSECAPQAAGSSASNFIEPQASIGSLPGARQQQPKWISFDSTGKCIDLHAIVPDKIPMISTGKIDLYIDRLPRLQHGHSYKCVFNHSEQTSATQTANGLSCPLPKLMDRQKYIQIESGKDHAIVDLAVRSSETNRDFLDGKIAFFECQRHTNCQDCLMTNWGCNWCSSENVCLFNASRCEKSPLTIAGRASDSQDGQQTMNGARQAGVSVVTTSGGSTLAMGSSQRGSTVITAPSERSSTIVRVQQCPNYDPTALAQQQQQQQQQQLLQTDILISDATELSSRDKNAGPQLKHQIRQNRPQSSDGLTTAHYHQLGDFPVSFSSSPMPILGANEQLGRKMHLQQQHQQQQEALFTSTIWTPHLRQPYQHVAGSAPMAAPVPPVFDSTFDELQFLQQANPVTKQQQLHNQARDSSTSTLVYTLFVSMSVVASLALALFLLVGLRLDAPRAYQGRFTRRPLDKLNALRSWLLQRRTFGARCGGPGAGAHERHCLHRRHLHASECAKCSQLAAVDENSASSPWPIVSAFGSGTATSSSGAFATLRGPQIGLGAQSSSIIVGLNPIARLGSQPQQQQQQQQRHRTGNSNTISSHIKQQLCFATQASKVSAAAAAAADNYGLGVGAGYYSVMNYAEGDRFAPVTYQQQPPTADLLGTGYQCQSQQPHDFAAHLPPSVYHIATLGPNTSSQTTRLIWQQSPNGNNPNATNTGYLIDGGAYMPLSSNSSGNAPGNTRTHSGSGSPIYQTIYG